MKYGFLRINKKRNIYKAIKQIYLAMGRIKTTLIKRTANALFKEYKEEFSTDFKKNKDKVGEFTDLVSKKLKNSIAGYLVRLVKKDKEINPEI